ncbi:lipoate-protein ligase A [Oscillibacter sp. PC13]|uniref:lipoate--protein ligase n=1 Tax=Oscillibacter sp. PC13 TaxID=1855299 RepID=UPI0008E484FE|nr:lipoate--protein ligase [Oscillibacter sp. PC13]SFP03457.1 lipoate-protein ligase A [Oscillibacter sp. PC13]
MPKGASLFLLLCDKAEGSTMKENKTMYLETGSVDPAYNLAFEEFILQNRKDRPYLLLWQNDNTIVIGQNQNAEAEIDRPFVEAHGIHVVRRTTGGGAVYHDLGNLNYSFITDVEHAETITYQQFTRPVVEALQGLGLQAEASGRNDILVEGRKVSGTAQRLLGKRVLHHGTLLFDSNPDMIAGALRADPIKFQSKSTQSVRTRVGNIRSFLKKDMELPAFWEYLKTSFGGGELEPGRLTPAELEQVRQLKTEKYDTWEWNFGRSPQFTVTNKRKWDGGILEIGVQVAAGRISEIRFYGDFLSLSPLDTLVQALQGCPFRREDVAAVLDRAPLQTYFGSITETEVLDTMFAV